MEPSPANLVENQNHMIHHVGMVHTHTHTHTHLAADEGGFDATMANQLSGQTPQQSLVYVVEKTRHK